MITCKFENDKEAHLRHAVVDGVMVEDGKILLTKRAPHLREGGKWALPGGFMDRDESTIEAVMREVLEETGYSCEVQGLLTVVDKPGRYHDDRQNISFVFSVKPIEKIGEPDDESTDMRWWPLDALPPQEEMAFDHIELIWEWIKQNDPELTVAN